MSRQPNNQPFYDPDFALLMMHGSRGRWTAVDADIDRMPESNYASYILAFTELRISIAPQIDGGNPVSELDSVLISLIDRLLDATQHSLGGAHDVF